MPHPLSGCTHLFTPQSSRMESVDDLIFLKCHVCMTKGQLDKGKGGGGGDGQL